MVKSKNSILDFNTTTISTFIFNAIGNERWKQDRKQNEKEKGKSLDGELFFVREKSP